MEKQYDELIKSLMSTNEIVLRQLDKQQVQRESIERVVRNLVELEGRVKESVRAFDALRHAVTRPTLDQVARFLGDQQLSMENTLEYLSTSDSSFARFREREFRIVSNPIESLKIPVSCHGIQSDLRTVLSTPTDDLMIGLPQFNRDIFWAGIWTEYWGRLQQFLIPHSRFGNSHVTRPVVFNFLGDRAIELWRAVWSDKNVKLVTGSKNMLDPSGELFDSARDISRVECRNRNAYQDIKGTLKLAVRDSPDMVLVSLGEAAPVLIRHLREHQVRAIDIGSLDASFKSVYSK